MRQKITGGGIERDWMKNGEKNEKGEGRGRKGESERLRERD